MSVAFFVIMTIFGVLLVLGIVVIGFYNRILFRRKRVLDKLDSLSNDLKERCEIIRKINNIFASSSFHEDNLMLELNDLYIKINENTDSVLNLINGTDKLLVSALSLEGVYPELAKNNEYLGLKDVFKENQYKVMYGVEIYNEEVEEYNNYRNKAFINIINKIFKFPNYDCYIKNKDDVQL